MTNLALGGDGFAAPEANLAPRLYASIIKHYAAGRRDEADTAFAKVVRLWSIYDRYGSARGTKATLDLLSLPGRPVRPPRLDVTETEQTSIATTLVKLDVHEKEDLPS